MSACLLALCLAPTRPNLWLAWFATVVLVGASVVGEDHALAAVLRFRPLAYIGVISYGMYLLNSLSIHLVMALLGHFHVQHPLAIFPLGLTFTIGVATISYRYYEKPFLSLKNKRFARKATEVDLAKPLAPAVHTPPGSGA